MKLSYNDAQHFYRLDGKPCKSVTTIAKIPDDTYGLNQWAKRQTLIGVALQPSLVERAAAHFDEKDTMNRLAEEALQAASSHQAAARGTAAHRITERIDLNQLIIDSPQARAVQAAWLKALNLAGLEIVPDLVERVVVYPDRRICGRFDRLALRKADRRLCVVDLKTGTSAAAYPHSIAIQLALYANAPLMAGPLHNGETEQFEPLPDQLDRTVGYIIHMPNDLQVDVIGVDIQAGWQAAQLCFQVLEWRAQKDLLIPVTEIGVKPERTTWIQDRLKVIGSKGAYARQQTAERWPWVVPQQPPWNDSQITILDRTLSEVERLVEAPFPPSDPTKQPEREPIT